MSSPGVIHANDRLKVEEEAVNEDKDDEEVEEEDEEDDEDDD